MNLKKQIKNIIKRIPGVLQFYHYRNKKRYREKYFAEPIQNNKIVFNNYMGRGYGCNCKYTAEKLLESGSDFNIVWLLSNPDDAESLPDGIRFVDYNSEDALYELATAKFWVSNYHFIDFFSRGMRKKEGQVYIQLWHGSFGIKKSEGDVKALVSDKEWLREAKDNSAQTDYWVSNSFFENKVYCESFWNVKNILEYGHPRNDVFFKDCTEQRNKIRDYFGISYDTNIILYVPTFRSDLRLECYAIDYRGVIDALTRKFGGKWIFAVRLHPKVAKFAEEAIPFGDSVYNATFYPDIQELLAGADAVVTDYSSAVFDFMLSKKPAFIFAMDIEQYNTERGLYYRLEETPFPVAEDNQTLIANIENFNTDKYCAEVDAFLKDKGSFEDGNAAQRVANLIIGIVNENNSQN